MEIGVRKPCEWLLIEEFILLNLRNGWDYNYQYIFFADNGRDAGNENKLKVVG
ncbi:MAG: hypothetical protein H8E57_01800 [Candidatus Cloacimonetes bacterium]|nr:hypothetical protein [Candidatus Cloacimonadota bacterium]